MTDISLIPILKSEGWKVMTRSKLKSMKKEELIETIETLENNYGAIIERANNSYNYGKSEIERLEKENAELKAENKQIIERERVVPEHYLCEMIEKCKELKKQNEKMKNFIFEEIDFCFYCPLTDTCRNDEGTCPYANITEEEQKKLLTDWITK